MLLNYLLNELKIVFLIEKIYIKKVYNFKNIYS